MQLFRTPLLRNLTSEEINSGEINPYIFDKSTSTVLVDIYRWHVMCFEKKIAYPDQIYKETLQRS